MNSIFLSFSILILLCLVMLLVFFIVMEFEDVPSSKNIFECGFMTHGSTHKSFSIQLFIMLVVFVCFDLELVILVIIFIGWALFHFLLFIMFMLLTIYLEWWWGSIKWMN